jgi:hypothetical protein
MKIPMTFEELQALRDRVVAAQDTDRHSGSTRAIAKLVQELNLKTLDGVPIRVGMKYVDYNLDWTTVTGITSVDMHSGVWFETSTGMFDATRLWARKP